MARGSIVKRSSGNYAIVYYVNKKQKWKTIGPSKKEAEKALREVLGALDKREYREIREITFEGFAEKWLSFVEGRVRTNTYQFYKYILEPYLIPHFGEFLLTNIRPDMIENYLSDLLKEARLSSRSISYHLRILRTMLKKAVAWDYLRQNPAERVEGIRVKHKEMEFLTPEELCLFLSKVNKELYPLFLTAVLTGMRQGELLGLKWGDLNWVTSRIHIRRALDINRRFVEPKSRSGERTIAMTPQLASILKKHQIASSPNDLNLVFASKLGKPLNTASTLRKEFHRALRKAGLRHIRFHDLRHSYAAMLIHQGESIKFIQHQLGHASVKTTLDKYGHLLPEVHNEAAERLDATLFGAGSGTIKRTDISRTLAKRVQESANLAKQPVQSR